MTDIYRTVQYLYGDELTHHVTVHYDPNHNDEAPEFIIELGEEMTRDEVKGLVRCLKLALRDTEDD